MRFSTKIIIIALIIMIPVTIRDILNKDLFNLSLDLIVIIINSLSVMLDIKSIKQDKEYKKMLYGLIDKEDVLDPYGQSQEVYNNTAKTIQEYIELFVNNLLRVKENL